MIARWPTLPPLLVALSALCAPGCADEPEEDFARSDESTGAETEVVTGETSESRGEEFENLASLLGTPNVTVYVDGPRRTGREELVAGGSGEFETLVTIVNDGDADLAIDELFILFEVWDENDERTKCVNADVAAPPASVDDEDAYIERAVATCTFPEAGDYEVQTYVAFEAGAFTGYFDIERHYAGVTEVTVGR